MNDNFDDSGASEKQARMLQSSSDLEALVVKINWGVKGLDRSGISNWDPNDMGKLVWDD